MRWDGRRKALTFSYDDGVSQDERLLEMMNRYGVRGTWNINSGLMREDNVFVKGTVRVARIAADRIPAMYRGHEIAAHMRTHPRPTALDDAALHAEIADDRRALEALCGMPVVGMAYPFGSYDDRVVEAVGACGIRYARTVESTRSFAMPRDLLRLPATCHHDDPALFDLAEAFLRADADEPMLFYVWGHSYEFDMNDNWQRMDDFLRLMSGRGDVSYLTNGEALL